MHVWRFEEPRACRTRQSTNMFTYSHQWLGSLTGMYSSLFPLRALVLLELARLLTCETPGSFGLLFRGGTPCSADQSVFHTFRKVWCWFGSAPGIIVPRIYLHVKLAWISNENIPHRDDYWIECVGFIQIEAYSPFDRGAFQKGWHMLGKRGIG